LLSTIPLLHWPPDGVPDECPQPPGSAKPFEATSHFIDLARFGEADAAQALTVAFKMQCAARVRVVAQSCRPVRVWLDGDQVLDLPGGFEVPAIHRAGRTGADVELKRGFYRLTFAVGAGADDPGRLFFAIGDPGRWNWIEAVEFGRPKR
jgi:hypothetical protein